MSREHRVKASAEETTRREAEIPSRTLRSADCVSPSMAGGGLQPYGVRPGRAGLTVWKELCAGFAESRDRPGWKWGGGEAQGPGGKEKMSYKELSGVAGVHMCTRCMDIYCSLV